MPDNPFAEAHRAREMRSVSTPMELLEAAKWGNPNLAAFVQRDPDLTMRTLAVIERAKATARSLVAEANLKLSQQRLEAAFARAARDAPMTVAPQTTKLPNEHELVREVLDAAQRRLDSESNARAYWFEGVPKLIELERVLNRELIDPLIEQGKIMKGIIRIWIGPHPHRPNTHHELAVHHVELEVAD